MSRMRAAVFAAIAVVALGAVVAIVAYRFGGGADGEGSDTQQIAIGQRVYAERCASCHGAKLEGQPNWRERKQDGKLPAPPHDATGHTWHHPDQVLMGITREGLAPFGPPEYRSDMPAFAGVLSEEEIAAVISFLKSTWPDEIRKRQAALTRSYEEKQK